MCHIKITENNQCNEYETIKIYSLTTNALGYSWDSPASPWKKYIATVDIFVH